MKTVITFLLLVFTLSVIPQADAADKADTITIAQRDPFQLPAGVKSKGLAAQLNLLAPAAGAEYQDR